MESCVKDVYIYNVDFRKNEAGTKVDVSKDRKLAKQRNETAVWKWRGKKIIAMVYNYLHTFLLLSKVDQWCQLYFVIWIYKTFLLNNIEVSLFISIAFRCHFMRYHGQKCKCTVYINRQQFFCYRNHCPLSSFCVMYFNDSHNHHNGWIIY